jgi:hypothetical protein
MANRKKEDRLLCVKAVKHAHVLPVGSTNQGPLQFVGKQFNPETGEFDIFEFGVNVIYHPEYIKYLKDGDLLPMDGQTAALAGV